VFQDEPGALDNRNFFKAIQNVPNSSLERLVVFHTALNTYPGYFDAMWWRMDMDEEFRWRVEAQTKQFPEGVRCYDIRDDYLLMDRCKFHEHPTGRCWRPAPMGPEEAPPEDEEKPPPEPMSRREVRDKERKEQMEVDVGEIDWFGL
jgi:hypothetical protein